MGLLDLVRADIVSITTDLAGFADLVTFTNPVGLSVTVAARPNKHHLAFNGEGVAVNTKQASVGVAEAVLIAAGYQTRPSGGEADLKGHRVSWTDSTGSTHTYLIREQFPDETLGLIVCILGDFK